MTRRRSTLAFDNGVRIPADVSAAINRTTILGDQFVQLNVPKNETGAGAATAPQLADGAQITHTSLVPDVEQFVEAGSEVFGAISTTELEQIIEAGGEGFTGQEASLKAFLADLTAVANGYAQHTSDITQAVNGLNSLTATLAPTSSASAHRARQPVPDGRHPGQELVAIRDAACSPWTTCLRRGGASSRTTTPRS